MTVWSTLTMITARPEPAMLAIVLGLALIALGALQRDR